MRTLKRLGMLALGGALASSCSDSVTGTATPAQDARIAIGAQFTPAASQIYNGLATFGMKVTTVHVRLVASDSSTRDTSLAFPSGISAVAVDLPVPARMLGQAFRADLELFDAEGFVLFSGSTRVTARDPATSAAPTMIDVGYTGPGWNAATIVVSPPTATGTGAASIPVTATALDASGASLPAVFVRWTTSDATLGTVSATGRSAATVTSAGKRGAVTISAVTPGGVTGTARVTLVPAPAKIVLISGHGQTAAAGSSPALPFVVEVQAADNLPVPGVAVTFRPMSSSCSVGTSTMMADANGRASTMLSLGAVLGAHQFEAAVTSLTPVMATVTATPAPPAIIQVASGNFQGGRVATALPQPLTARVTNRFGAPVEGVTVAWSAPQGAGVLSASTSTTGADGTTSVSFTLGTNAKTQSVRAALPAVSGSQGETFFTVVIMPGAPAEIYAASGNGQHGPGGSQLANPLVATVTDQYGNPLQDYGVAWTIDPGSAGTATFGTAMGRTDATGSVSTSVTLGNTAGPLKVVASINDLSATFNLTVDQGAAGLPGQISGFVYNGVTGAPMGGVSVDISASAPATNLCAGPGCALASAFSAPISRATILYSVVTGSDGRYTTPTVPAGCYDITLSYANFILTTIQNQCVDGNVVVEAAPLVPFSAAPGSITGTVLNATTNQAVLGAVVVELRAGMNNIVGQPLVSLTTTNGQYQFTGVAPGTYTVRATGTGYSSAYKTGIAVGATNTGNQNVFLSPLGAAGSVRIVLTWRATPRDLDSHLTGPTPSGSRFHVWYAGQGSCTSAPFACLDVDVTSGYGPETVTIPQTLPGMYRYSVQNYSAAGNGSNPTDLTLSNSGGRVDVYIDNVLVRTFAVPAGAGSLWTVFELNGTTITPINAVSAGPVLFSSRIPATGAAQATPRATDAGVIFDGIRARPKSRLFLR